MSRITIIIPAYNCEKYLEACLESILCQTFQEWDVILVDDGSTDGTAEICRRYAERDPRFQYRHKENGGVSSARNYGLHEAAAEYIMFVDADDLIDPRACEALFAVCDAETDMSICGFERRFYQGERLHAKKDVLPDCQDILGQKELGESFGRLYETTLLTSVCAKLYRRRQILDMPAWFDEQINLGEDVLFNLQYLRLCRKIAVVNQPYYVYNHRGEKRSLTRKPSEERIRVSSVLLKSVEAFAEEKGIYPQVKERLWKVFYKDYMNYLEQFSFGERLGKAGKILRSEDLRRVLRQDRTRKADMMIYRVFLGSNRLFLCIFAGMRRTAKKIARGI